MAVALLRFPGPNSALARINISIASGILDSGIGSDKRVV
jgi:hypothetical protein